MTPADLPARLAASVAATSPAEAAAAALGLAYLVLAIRQRPLCWAFAAASTALYLYVFALARLPLQAALQGYYLAMAAYGWWAWRGGRGRPALAVTRAGWRVQAAGVATVLAASALTAPWLARTGASAAPWLDSLTTWGSVFTTWLVARKHLENWAWWLVVDALIVALCWRQGLYATALLYALYLGLVVVGWREWRRDLDARERRAGEAVA